MKIVNYEDNKLKIKFFNIDKDDFFKTLENVKSIYGREFDIQSKTWTAPPTKNNIEQLSRFGFDLDESVFVLFEKEKKVDNIKLNNKMLDIMYPFQVDGVKFLKKRNGNALIADSMGLGKTLQAIGYCIEHPELKPILIICPASVKLNWRNEIIKWTDYKESDINILYGKTPQGSVTKSCWYIINYDILDAWQDWIIENKFEIIIADESQYICNRTSLRTKAFRRISKKTERRIFLSGTPIKNSPKEFFTVLNLLDKKLFPNEYKFLFRYCNPKHNGFGWSYKGVTNWEELNYNIQHLMIRREKEEVLKDLPRKRKIIVPVECGEKEFEKYKEAIENTKDWVNEDEKKNMLELKNRLEFISNLAYGAKRESALSWIKDYLDTGEKLVVFAYHIKVLDDIESYFKKIKKVRIDGGVKAEDRQKYVEQFQNDPETKLFIGQIKAAGVGITLTAASSTCFLEFGWTPADLEQAEDRVHRIGQEADSVTAYYLIGEGTIEKDIIELLQQKYDTTKKVLDGKENENFFEKDKILSIFGK